MVSYSIIISMQELRQPQAFNSLRPSETYMRQ